jgi:SAM-dependent methyltransferase
MNNNIEVIDFRFLTRDDRFELKYNEWSRIYEYPYVLNILKSLGTNEDSLIHNTCWGFYKCHVTFKNDLDDLYNNVLHSDIRKSELNNTILYDITQKIEEKYKNYFDVVLNISTIEEVNYPNDIVLNNLFEQVKPGGYLIITFDYDKNNCNSFGNGSMNLSCVEDFVNKKIEMKNTNIISGSNSELPDASFFNLNCGTLVIKKISI